MVIDDKQRVIGKIVSINSDRFSVELLSGLKNFTINGFDDIHQFAQINSYVIVPFQTYYIVAEVTSIREKEMGPVTVSQKEQELSKVLSAKYLEVLPIGTIKNKDFIFGVSVFPTLYSDVLYVKDDELDAIFEIKDSALNVDGHEPSANPPTRLQSLEIGTSAVFQNYKVRVDIDKFFGGHSAVLGNTGSGKSCTVASIVQTLFKKEDFSAIGASFIVFDVNGEYEQAFSGLKETNSDIDTKVFNIESGFYLPHYFLNIDEWALLLNASEKTQLPILRNALGFSTLFSGENAGFVNIKNHILASCILLTYESSDSPVSKYQKIQALLRKGSFEQGIDRGYSGQYGNFNSSSAEANFIENIGSHLCEEAFEIPNYKNLKFGFEELIEYLEIAILYEESHGNKQIRDYCSSLITRVKTLRERDEYEFIRGDNGCESIDAFIKKLLGLDENSKTSQITIINLNSADDEIVEVLSSVITRLIFDKLRTMSPRNQFPVNLILEEAHRYLSYDSTKSFTKASRIFDRVAKEGRKYGLFFLISSQRPSELSKTVLSQCNNFIVHRIQNPEDLSHIRQITPHISETTLKKLPSIPNQHALVFGGAVNLPTLVKINKATPLPNSDNNQVSSNWFVRKDKRFVY